jgi:hypothetical protein
MGLKNRGFARMEPQRQREIASQGGRMAHQAGRAHEWTSAEAAVAGRKGALARKAPIAARSEVRVPFGALAEGARSDLMEQAWQVRGLDGRVLQCAIHRVRADLEVCVGYADEPLARSELFRTLAEARRWAQIWLEAVLANRHFEEM